MAHSTSLTPYRYKFKESAFAQVRSLQVAHPGVFVDFTKFLNQITDDFSKGSVSGSIPFSKLIDGALAKASTPGQAKAVRDNFEKFNAVCDAKNVRYKPDVINDHYNGEEYFIAAIFAVDYADRSIIFVDFDSEVIVGSLFGD